MTNDRTLVPEDARKHLELAGTSRRGLLALGSATTLALTGSTKAQVPPPPSLPSASTPIFSAGEVSVTAFGAHGDGKADDYRAIMAAVAEASRHGCDLIFPAGTYAFDQTLNLGLGGLRIFGRGKVILLYKGRGYALTADAGENAIFYNHHLENLLVMGDGSPDQHGILIRNVVHSARRNLRVTNISGIAFDIAGDVLSTYDHCRVADNESARPDMFPAIDFRVRGTTAVTATTACLFINCMAERARQAGWQIEKADNCRWIGGTAEGIEGVGIRISAASKGNVFESFFMEQNRDGDVVCSGFDATFRDCSATSRAAKSPYDSVPSIKVTAGTQGFTFTGGSAYAIAIEQGATNSRIMHTDLSYRVNDAGRGTVIHGCRQGYNSAATFPSQTLGNVDNPDPLALDWYHEAVFTPVIMGKRRRGAFVLDGHGASTRIGNIVFLSLTVRIDAIPSRAGGDLVLGGLPYPAMMQSILSVFAEGRNTGEWKALTEAGATGIRVVVEADGRLSPVEAGLLQTGTILTISGSYMV